MEVFSEETRHLVRFQAAWADACLRHVGQKYGEHDYDYHLRMVVERLLAIGADEDELCAAALHDTIEDTGATKEELCALYGVVVSDIVWAVTGEGTSRKDQARSIVRKVTAYLRAVNTKLADRTSNLFASIEKGRWDLIDLYEGERPLYDPVFEHGHAKLRAEYAQLWAEVQARRSELHHCAR